MKYYQLNNGNKIPAIGFGTYKAQEDEGIAAVKKAIETGYRLIDTAAKYENEEAVGKAIKQSGIAREELMITTKLWRENLGYESTKKAFETSLAKLDLDYIDLYLIHWPANAKNYENWQKANNDSWRAMEELVKEGKIKNIGVSNFWPEHLEPLLEAAEIKPVINQIEFHPGYWQPELTRYCKEKNILIEAWSPLARGKVFESEEIKAIAKKYNKSVAQICLRWILEHNALVIPKSSTPERIEHNFDIFDFQLNAEDIKTIDNLPQMGFSGELPNHWPDRV
ncbi:aldo/keto reductase [Mesonia mobilis]|uniref:2,5-diketo-D-gluconic acid reductase n=1 Tax=Mesonia mobilis TaxID=369791 RepID=A0ABQ3BRI0_9FLAO|nr:aldo/keto reductase [Mesonia mobilis]MBQ0738434.1 aldo/keto reductase [Aquimarina celericrescens]GGZ52559.1 2,5-diketo-D-gluconic acid reductase [Mesonia mobilis]